MIINWFTILAQALNFLILLWLMKRFLYKPILHAIDEREKLIASKLAEADEKKVQAQKEREEFLNKNEEFDRQRGTLMERAERDAEAERKRLLTEAQQAADVLSTSRKEALRSEVQELNQSIRSRTIQEVFAITRKTLQDLAGTDLEERMGEMFASRLREMDKQTKEDLAGAIKRASAPALVRSAFDLPAEQKGAIQTALSETFSDKMHVCFKTSPDLVSGIELTVNGHKVAWSIDNYLAALEKGVEEIMEEHDKPAPEESGTGSK
jgi:F-type H+-transporting ATPase subunit b